MASLENRDIVNKDLFSEFIEKRKKWISLFDPKVENSIADQVYKMLWDDAIFRVINEIRRRKIEFPNQPTGINSDVSHLIDRGYVNLQATAIRSLIDQRTDVVSLMSSLNDMEESLGIITRENYVGYDGLKYDPEKNDDEFKETMCSHRHKIFDQLSSMKKRNREDQIDPKVIQNLRDELNICKDVQTFSHKYIAHKAGPSELDELDDSERGITLDQIAKCHKAIVKTGNFIYGSILGEGELGGIPTPQYDHFKDLDKPWIIREDLEPLWEFWHLHVDTVDNWASLKIKIEK